MTPPLLCTVDHRRRSSPSRPATYTPVVPANPVLRVADLRVRFGERDVLCGVDLSVDPGRVTVLLGPNGAGKTTLVRCCTGLLSPASGLVEVAGMSPDEACAAGRVGLMPQHTGSWFGIRTEELLGHLAGLHPDPLPLTPLVERLGLTGALRTPYRRLSGGQQQAVNLIGALVGRPELVFLDEPTAGMDPRARRTTWSLVADLARAGVGVLLTTHDMAEAAELGDLVAIIDDGRVRRCGTVAELTAGGDDLEDVFLAVTGSDH